MFIFSFQFDDEDIEEDIPLERRKKFFTKERKLMDHILHNQEQSTA